MTLLIVDDDILAIQGILDDVQWDMLDFTNILTANCYAEAVNLFISQKIDVLLCDIEMPFGDGITLVTWVHKNYPQTQCIFLTCHDDFKYAKNAIDLQCVGYILKPAETNEIVSYLKEARERLEKSNENKKYSDFGKQYIESIKNDISGKEVKNPVKEVEKYISAHISEPLKSEELAGIVYLSVAHLGRLFKKKHNMTIVDYITGERIKLACELLKNQDIPVSLIATKCGYNNYSYFTKTFKKIIGKTPKEYRYSQN